MATKKTKTPAQKKAAAKMKQAAQLYKSGKAKSMASALKKAWAK